jgi:hypothetical protein
MAWIFEATPIAKYNVRYLIVAHPPLFIFPAAAVGYLLARRPALTRTRLATRTVGAVAIVAVLLATAGTGLRNLYFDSSFHKADFRAIAETVQQGWQAGDVVMLLPGPHFPLWQYYGGDDDWVAVPELPTTDVNAILHYGSAADAVNGALAGQEATGGVWLVVWEGDRAINDPSGILRYLLCEAGREVAPPVREGGISATRCVLAEHQLPLPPVPDVSHEMRTTFDEIPLTAVGCNLPDRVPADGTVPISCFWTAGGKLPRDVSVSARLIDRSGVEWARGDATISGLPAGRWPVGEFVLGQYAIQPPPGLPPGGFYETRLIVHGEWGRREVKVADLTVDRPSSPPSWGAFSFSQLPYEPVALENTGLILESASVEPQKVIPGEEVLVEAIWLVEREPVSEPRLAVGDEGIGTPLIARPGGTEAWQAGDRYRTLTRVQVSPYAPGGELLVRANSVDGSSAVLSTVQCGIDREFTVPTDVTHLEYQLGSSIALAGARATVSSSAAATTVDVTVAWQAVGYVQKSYTAFVHLVGPDGQIASQCDSVPRAATHPTDHWIPGEVVVDDCQLVLEGGQPAGQYRVLVGMYKWPTLKRLQAIDGSGEPVPDDAIVIATFDI